MNHLANKQFFEIFLETVFYLPLALLRCSSLLSTRRIEEPRDSFRIICRDRRGTKVSRVVSHIFLHSCRRLALHVLSKFTRNCGVPNIKKKKRIRDTPGMMESHRKQDACSRWNEGKNVCVSEKEKSEGSALKIRYRNNRGSVLARRKKKYVCRKAEVCVAKKEEVPFSL